MFPRLGAESRWGVLPNLASVALKHVIMKWKNYFLFIFMMCIVFEVSLILENVCFNMTPQ